MSSPNPHRMKNNYERVQLGMEYLYEGLFDYVDDVMTNFYGTPDWHERMALESAQYTNTYRKMEKEDIATLLQAIIRKKKAFKYDPARPNGTYLGHAHIAYASELIEVRNRWAHTTTKEKAFTTKETRRFLETAQLLLNAVDAYDSAASIEEIISALDGLTRSRATYDHVQKAKAALSNPAIAGTKPWRELVKPHIDVQQGNFSAAEFAADLHQVHFTDSAATEYSDPAEFFSRTFLTEGLRDLLVRAIGRMAGSDKGRPVINLQTNFGGGKTHSMLALYHLFSGTDANDLPQEIQDLLEAEDFLNVGEYEIKRVVLVGTRMSPATPSVKPDGTVVRTMWGELAYQLGGAEAYALVKNDDEKGTNPGEALGTLLKDYGPAIILIDEWVAYARQLVGKDDLEAGTFETQFTFAQSLSEAVSTTPGTMLVISIPASDATDISTEAEVGGKHGREALEKLQNVVRRVADQWRPSTRDESFEIVRRRIFQDPDRDACNYISALARQMVTLYRENPKLFPSEAGTSDSSYENRIIASFPLHPELLDRLYEDWSTLDRFQRTRGVLKLVSAIVHELWIGNDASPIILPGTVPLEQQQVNSDLTSYLTDSWKPVIDSDIAGRESIPAKVDKNLPILGERLVAQRIAKAIFMGATPRKGSNRKGLDRHNVYLGTALPGDKVGNFTSAIENIEKDSAHFYESEGRFWFDTIPSQQRTAREYAERLLGDMETVNNEIIAHLSNQRSDKKCFAGIHICPESSAEVPDDDKLRLVIVPPTVTSAKTAGPAITDWARDVVQHRGSASRTNRNRLVFLAAEKSSMETVQDNMRSYLGWKFVLENLTDESTAQDKRQAMERCASLENTVDSLLLKAYCLTVFPEQFNPKADFEMSSAKIKSGLTGSLAQQVYDTLSGQDQIVDVLDPGVLGDFINDQLRTMFDEVPHYSVRTLWEQFSQYPYLYRLKSAQTLFDALNQAPTGVFAGDSRFGLASGFDEATGTYENLVAFPNAAVNIEARSTDLIVQAAVADAALAQQPEEPETEPDIPNDIVTPVVNPTPAPVTTSGPSRFHGVTVTSNDQDLWKWLSAFGDEIYDILLSNADSVKISLTIDATSKEGFSEHTVRAVRENATTLGFREADFDS